MPSPLAVLGVPQTSASPLTLQPSLSSGSRSTWRSKLVTFGPVAGISAVGAAVGAVVVDAAGADVGAAVGAITGVVGVVGEAAGGVASGAVRGSHAAIESEAARSRSEERIIVEVRIGAVHKPESAARPPGAAILRRGREADAGFGA
jgi:hypothetical protein